MPKRRVVITAEPRRNQRFAGAVTPGPGSGTSIRIVSDVELNLLDRRHRLREKNCENPSCERYRSADLDGWTMSAVLPVTTINAC